MDELQHECGIAALYHFGPTGETKIAPNPMRASDLIPRMLIDLQNRGQLAAGMATWHPTRPRLIDVYKELGMVTEAFRLNRREKVEEILKEFAAPAAIGHVRYATCGADRRSFAQPFERRHACRWKWFSFAFNGQIANVSELKQRLLSLSDYHLTLGNDTEVIMHYLAHALRGDVRRNLVDVFQELSEHFDGAYNLVFLNAMGDMVVLRDPKGIRPLCYATDGPLLGAASENVPLLNLGFRDIQTLAPGEMILVQNGQMQIERFAPKQPTAHCFFEWIYFANVASTLDEKSVYLARSALGRELAECERKLGKVPLDEDTIIVPVPDTGKAAADAMAFELKLRSVEGLMRNRAVGRTFIEGANRLDRVRLKYTPLKEVMQGKRVILVEDSIVRSTTMKALLEHLRERGGAKEIHVRVACPPIIAPCYYGIDMSRVGELFAPRFMRRFGCEQLPNGVRPPADAPTELPVLLTFRNRSQENETGDFDPSRLPTLPAIGGEMPSLESLHPTPDELEAMTRDIRADSLFYLPIESVARCVGLPPESLCQACITGHYPTTTGTRLYELDRMSREKSDQRPFDTQ
jgi:amidophosphoribosyltransferase